MGQAVAWVAALAPALTSAPPGSYTQDIEVEYASPEDATRASATFAPVYDGKQWAFSARWDDSHPNNLIMRERMAKFGLKGTFYLTGTDTRGRFGTGYARQLLRDGFSIGGHSQTHRRFTTLAPNEIFYEVLANRIERECQIDRPINSFAFPYGLYKDAGNPVVLEAVTRALRRAGYHHCVYQTFIRGNPYLAEHEFSTGLQVVPGDHRVDATRFRERLGRIFKWPDTYAKVSRCIFLGVHARQQGDEWLKLEAVFRELADQDGWWYCNLTEYAAYSRQVHTACISPHAPTGARRRYTLTRLEPAVLGAAAPLTWVIRNAAVRAVRVDGASVAVREQDDTTVVNLAHAAGKALPRRIDRIDNPGNRAELTEKDRSPDFPGLRFLLTHNGLQQRLALSCENATGDELREVRVTFRLPLQYERGLVARTIGSIARGTTQAVGLSLPQTRVEAAWQNGPSYYVAQIDFIAPTGTGRVYATVSVP